MLSSFTNIYIYVVKPNLYDIVKERLFFFVWKIELDATCMDLVNFHAIKFTREHINFPLLAIRTCLSTFDVYFPLF
jgi:hypothetical protein